MSDPNIFRYIDNLRDDERRSFLSGLVPDAVRAYLRGKRYRQRFANCFISARSDTALSASIGEGVIVRRGCHVGENVEIGRFTTLGDNCLLRGRGALKIGAFCSIAPEVVILSENHALGFLATFPLELYRDGENIRFEEFDSRDVEIGNDVWIGQRVMILPGARIGSGCVVAAGSVVPQGDYRPYSIIAGVPGRVIRERFDEKTRDALVSLQWWDAPSQQIFRDWFDDLHAKDISGVSKMGQP